MAWDITSFQDVWFYGRLPNWTFFLGFAAVSLLSLLGGILIYGRLSLRFAEEVKKQFSGRVLVAKDLMEF